MKKVAVLLILGLSAVAQNKEYGEPLEKYREVQAFSRGQDLVGESDLPLDTQCVQLARNFATFYHGGNFVAPVDCAAKMWNLLPEANGYLVYPNGSGTKPQEGDLIIWWNNGWQSCDSGAGHVAVHSGERDGQIRAFEQNWPEFLLDGTKVDNTAFRWLNLRNESGQWYIDSGASNYFVKGWLRKPGYVPEDEFGFSPGERADGTIHQPILNEYNRLKSLGIDVGWPIDDGGGVFVHKWLPWNYDVQNFRNARGEESVIMYGHRLMTPAKAYRISGNFWELYRTGRWDPLCQCQRFGPDIPMGDGTTLGAPVTDAINGVQRFERGTQVVGSVELYRLDGTLVEIYQPTGEFSALTAYGKLVSQTQMQLEITGGPQADYYNVFRNGQLVGQVALPEFTETGLQPGSSHKYQVKAVSNAYGVLDVSNEVQVLMPGQQGSVNLQAMPDGANSVFIHIDNTLNDTEFYVVYRNGVQVAKIAGNAYSDFPLEPNKAYIYQVALTTFSGLVIELSNSVTVTTEPVVPPSPDPDPVPTFIQVEFNPVMEFNTGQYVVPTVYDQYGNIMTGIELLFLSSDSGVAVVLPELGWLWANGLGQAEIWVEVKDRRYIKSERVAVSVVAEYQDEPETPQSYPPAEFIQLAHDIEILTPAPLVTPFWGTWGVILRNPTNITQSFEGPSVAFLDAAGNVVGVSSYMGGIQSLAPGEEKRFVFQGSFNSDPGNYYLAAVVKPVGSGLDDWLVVDQTVPGVSNRKAMQVVSLADLRAELETRHFKPVLNADGKLLSDSVELYAMLLQSGDLNITVPFEVKVVLTGNGINQTLSQTVNGLNMGWPKHLYFDFSPLPAGVYKAELFVDPDDIVAEYSKADNTKTIIVEVLPVPEPPKPNASIQIDIVGSYRVGDVALGTGVIPNQGQVDTGRVDYRITDGVVTVDGFVDNVPAGGSVPISFSLPLSQEGEVMVLAVVDPNNTLAESDESDNDDFVDLTVLPALKPDLVAYDISWVPADSPMQTGRSYEVTGLFRNDGLAATGAFNVELKIGGESNPPQFTVPGLAVGQTASVSRIFTPTIAQNLGITFSVDSLGSVVEIREDNNGRTEVVSITTPVATPELQRRSTSYNGNRKNGAVNFSVSVENTGQVSSGAFTVKVVVPEIGKVLTQRFTGLSAGAFGSKSFSFKTPYRGQLTFQVTIDSAAQVAESNETNNYFEERYAL